MKLRTVLLLLLMPAIFSTAPALAAVTYYVSPSGSDVNPGTITKPWATLGYASRRVAVGDTVIARGGTYREAFSIITAGTVWKNYSGETPVIDGEEMRPSTFGTSGLVNVRAADVVFDGFQIKRAKDRGISIGSGGHRARLRNLKIYDCWEPGLVVEGGTSGVTVEDSQVYRCQWRKYYADNPTKRPDPNWNYSPPFGANVTVVRCASFVMRRCKVYDSYFEGVDIISDADNTLVENCEIYGNSKLQVYLSASKFATVRYNLIYGTDKGRGTGGVWLGGEDWAASTDRDRGHRIYGNVIANCRNNILFAGEPNSGVRDSYAFNNTLVYAYNTDLYGKGLFVPTTSQTGNVFRNNAILQPIQLTDSVATGKVSVSNNLWSRKPTTPASGAGDVINSFTLAKTSGWNDLTGGSLTKASFQLTSDASVARNRGAWLTLVNMSGGAQNATKITVDNAGFFYGDEDITFQNGAKTRIQSKSGNILTVSPAVTVPDNSGVALSPFVSAGPCIGAWLQDSTLAPPKNFTLSAQ